MLHPSYTDLMAVVNSEVEEGEQPVVESRYSIVIAAAKRARQIISGSEPLTDDVNGKPLSIAVEELYSGKVKILSPEEEDDEDDEDEEFFAEDADLFDDSLKTEEEGFFDEEFTDSQENVYDDGMPENLQNE